MQKISTILLLLLLANANRMLFENTKTSDKWQFTLFYQTVKQNTESVALTTGNILLIQNVINEQGLKQINLTIHQKDGTQVGEGKLYQNKQIEYIRPKIQQLKNQNLVISWIQIEETGYSLCIQLLDSSLNQISNQISIGQIHKEVSWDQVSEFYQIKQINDEKLLIVHRDQSKEKNWSGFFYNLNNQQQSNSFTLNNSNNLQLAMNSINTIVILQEIENEVTDFFITKINDDGLVLMTRKLQKLCFLHEIQYLPKLVALSNNNFVVLHQDYNQLFYYVYDQHFNSLLFNSQQKYENQRTTTLLEQNSTPSWEYNNYIHGGQIQVITLEGSLVITGINYDNFRSQLIQLNNDYLEFVQLREIHYEDLNIYKFNTQKLDDYSVFVSWIDGQPQTMLPEFVQNLYLSSLNLKLTLTNCDANCKLCQADGICTKCNDRYQITNNSCTLNCIENCSYCSTDSTCDVCNSGFNFNNQLQCVSKNNNQIQELQVSISETTFKFNQEFKILENNNILSVYQEQLGNEFNLQFRLIDTQGHVINSLQLSANNVIDYDFIVLSTSQGYFYTLEISEGYYVIKQKQFNPSTLEFSTVIRLQIQNQGFSYAQNIKDSLIALKFTKTVGFIIQGLDYSQAICMNVYFYTYDGQFINNQFLGKANYNFNFDFKYFDYQIDYQYVYIFISRYYNHNLVTLDQNGNRISDSYNYQFTTYYYWNLVEGNPSIQKIQNTNKFMIAIEQWQSIFVFLWQDTSILYQTKKDIKVRKPTLIAYSEKKFSLLFEQFDYKKRFNTLEYIYYNGDSVQYQQTINQKSLYPNSLQIYNNNNEYLTLTWLGFQNTKIIINQLYVQSFSLADQQLLGIGQQCPTNCQTCDQDKNCQQSCLFKWMFQMLRECMFNMLKWLLIKNKIYNLCINSNYQCEISESNLITIIKQDTSQLQSIDLETNSNGNILISWMNIDLNSNTKQTYIKQIDWSGNQVGNDYTVNQCTSAASKVFSIQNFNVLSTICGSLDYGANIDLHFYDTNFNFKFQTWSVSGVKMIQYSTVDTPYDILFTSDNEFVIAFQIMKSISDIRLRILRVIKYDQENYFCITNDRTYHKSEKLNNLKLSTDSDYVYLNYDIIVQIDNGTTQQKQIQLKLNYNCDIIQKDSHPFQNKQLLFLQNSNNLVVINDNQKIQISIISNTKQIKYQQIQASDDQAIENVVITATETGFYLGWIEKNQNTNFKQIKAQGFFNNGTQITDIQNLPQISNYPSNLIIQNLRGNQLIAIWYDSNNQGQSIYTSRYNQYLQIVPLNTLLCSSNCDSCIRQNTCAQCSKGYSYNVEKAICELQCIQNCDICTYSQFCDVCAKGYYLQNDQCVQGNEKQDESSINDIKDADLTNVCLANFSDNSFVVVWNDEYNGQQSIFLQFFDASKQKVGDFQIISTETNKQYVKVETFADDTFAMVWFDGNCSDSCRLIFQTFDRNGQAIIEQQTISIVQLPPLRQQQPVKIKRLNSQGMLITYLSYENNLNVGYIAEYEQSINSLNIVQQVEPCNFNIDNLEILLYNVQSSFVYYIRNNNELRALEIQSQIYSQIYTSQNQLKCLSALVRSDGMIILSWIETTKNSGNLNDKIVFVILNSQNGIVFQKQLDSYPNESQNLQKIVGQFGNQGYDRYSIIYEAIDQVRTLKRKIRLTSFSNYDSDQINNQINIISYVIKQFDIKEFINDSIVLVSVGQLADGTSKLLMSQFNIIGNQLEFGTRNCQTTCASCTQDSICLLCKIGFILNNGQCQRECDLNCKCCDPYWNQNGFQCYECYEGYQLNSQQQCQPIDNSISQQLINTYQTGNQYDQKVAVLQNQQSIIVWTSENQNQNGKSIYMQLYDQQFNKVGAEILVTKDNIGVQEQPDITALPNNEFMIIWKDNNSSSGRRILMQRFNEKQERVGDAITVYDSSVDLYLNGEDPITYLDSYHQIVAQQNGHISVVILLKVSTNLYDIRLKQFNEKYQEYNSITIGSTSQQDQCQATVLNNLLFVTWKSNLGIKILTVNEQGDNLNGDIVQDSTEFSNPSVTPISQNELILAYSYNNQLSIQKYDTGLQKVNDPVQVKTDFQIKNIQVVNIDSGYVVVYKEQKQTQYYISDLIYFLSFDSNGAILSTQKVIVNNFYGSIRDIRLSTLSNDEVLVSWTQLINYYSSDKLVQERNQNDLNGDGVYIKRYNSNGNVQSIQNVVCQTYCKQCSESNLCEVCADGYQFDEYKLLCKPICPTNCSYCSRYQGQYKSYCQKCEEGYNVNDSGDCSKIVQQQESQQYYYAGEQVRQILTLQNGNIVIVKQMYEYEAIFKIIDQSGNIVANEVWVENTCCKKVIKFTALATQGFVIVHRSFYYQNDQTLYLNMYDNFGISIKQISLYAFSTWSYYYWWDYPYANDNLLNVQSLSDGGFILFYMTDNDGQKYHSPQMYFRIYNKEFYVTSGDIKLKTYYTNNYYWDWSRNYDDPIQQNLNILENANHLIISFGTCLYNGWDEKKSYVQIFAYDQEGQLSFNKQVEIQNDYWWNSGYSPRFYLFQKSLEQYLLISFSAQKVFGTYLDSKFNKINEKSINYSYYWDTCYGCCYDCWNQNTIQAAQLANALIISSKSVQSQLNLQSFNYDLEPITSIKQLSVSRQSSNILWNHFIQQFSRNVLLVTQIVHFFDTGRNAVFNKFDHQLNKVEWSLCDENCLNCYDNKKQCVDCKYGYYLNEQRQCKSYCIDANCSQCVQSSTNIQKCSVCNSGFELKDNNECVAIDSSKIRETLLAQSKAEGQITPRIKTFSNGEFLLMTLRNQNEIYAQYYDQVGLMVGSEVLLISYPNIYHFDFSVSKQEDLIVVALVSSDYQAYLKKFNIDLSYISDLVSVNTNTIENGNQFQVEVEYSLNDDVLCLFYSQIRTWMMIYRENDATYTIKQIELNQDGWGCYWWGCLGDKYCNDWGCWNYMDLYNQDQEYKKYYNFMNTQNEINLKYIDYFSYWYAREPSTIITDNYIIVVAQHYDSIHAQTFDLQGNLLFQQFYKLFAPYQPAVAQLENGKIVIVWKDIIQNYYSNEYSQTVPKYKQTVIAYTITDEQFNTVRIQYIGKDYVQEERPDVTAIVNGFAISFSGRSEITNSYIDLRVAYFDLNGNLQTGFIPVSSQCEQPINSNLEKLNDGSLIISWYQGEQIYIQKMDRNGILKQLEYNLICPSNCQICKTNDKCEVCKDGYEINTLWECTLKQSQACDVNNCQICEQWSNRCQLCQLGYFLEESLSQCTQLDNSQNLETKVAQTNIWSDKITLLLQVSDSTVIHLWLNQNNSKYELWGQTFTSDGSQIIDQTFIKAFDTFIQIKGTSKKSNILILVYNSSSTQVIRIDENLNILVDLQDVTKTISQQFEVSYEWENTEIQLFENGYILQIVGIRQKIINQMSNNPEIKQCRITQLLIFDLNGQQTIPTFSFWIDGQPTTGFLDDYGQCKVDIVSNILYEDYIYVLVAQQQIWNQLYLSVFDYSGQKLKEVQQTSYWDILMKQGYYAKNGEIKLLRYQSGELCIINREGFGYLLSQDYSIIQDIKLYTNTYFYNQFDVYSSNNFNLFLQNQQFGFVQRRKMDISSNYNSPYIEQSYFISKFTVNQGSFNSLKLSNGQIIFNWVEQNSQYESFGQIIIIRIKETAELSKFPTFSCQDQNCSFCSNIKTCKSCKPDYYLNSNNSCSPICSDNCQQCSKPHSCDICVANAYVNDYQECKLNEQQIKYEAPIPFDRADEQNKPRIAAFTDGSFIVVWQSKNQDGDGYGIYAQKFNSDLTKLGDEVRVNRQTINDQYFPDVTILDNQSIIIIWIDGDLEISSTLYYQKFDSNLIRVGNPVFVSTLTLYYVSFFDTPCVVQKLTQNQFAIQWINTININDISSQLYVTVFDSNGVQHETNQMEIFTSKKEIVIASNGINFVTNSLFGLMINKAQDFQTKIMNANIKKQHIFFVKILKFMFYNKKTGIELNLLINLRLQWIKTLGIWVSDWGAANWDPAY